MNALAILADADYATTPTLVFAPDACAARSARSFAIYAVPRLAFTNNARAHGLTHDSGTASLAVALSVHRVPILAFPNYARASCGIDPVNAKST